MLPDKHQCGHEWREDLHQGLWGVGQAQSLQPRLKGGEVHEAVLRVGNGTADVPVHMQEGLGVGAVSLLQVVQDTEHHHGAQLTPHRLQPRQTSAPELQGDSGQEACCKSEVQACCCCKLKYSSVARTERR